MKKRGRDEDPLYDYKTWNFNGVWEKYTLVYGKVGFIVRVCCFGVSIILSLLDFNFETSSK